MDFLNAYCGDHFYTSSNIIWFGSYSVVIFTITLIGSFVMYISLSISAAREESNAGIFDQLEGWKRLGHPVTMILNVFLFVGIIFFFVGLVVIGFLRVTSTKNVTDLIAPMYCLLLPCFIISMLIGVVSYRMTFYSTKTGSTASVVDGRAMEPDESEISNLLHDESIRLTFRKHNITSEILTDLSNDDLMDMGITNSRDRKNVLKAIKRLDRVPRSSTFTASIGQR